MSSIMSSTDKKRKNQTDGGNHKNKKRNTHIVQFNNLKNCQGFFVTCFRDKEKQAQKEIIEVLNECPIVSEFSENKKEAADDQVESTSNALAAEIAALQSTEKGKREKLFTAFNLYCPGLIGVKINTDKLDPIDVARSVMHQLSTKGSVSQVSRNCTQLIPLQVITDPEVDNIVTTAKKLCEPIFTKENSFTFGIRIKRRNSKNIPKTEIIDGIAKIAGENHKVDLKNPQVVIMIQIFKSLVGISVVEQFDKVYEFNMRKAYAASVESTKDDK